MSEGVVYLVGAGPGDAGLLTMRGAELLGRAQVVVYDYLVNPQLLALCPGAEKIYVGKQAARHFATQEQINDLLVAQGRLGKRVVRLKGGDPFVFGRGGEECEAARAGVRFEVTPGITAGIAAAAYAGIPVTHRDLNSSFTLITGHEKEGTYQEEDARERAAVGGGSDLDWGAIAKLPCVAFYMGAKALGRICTRLMENGMDPQRPAATIQWGTTARQKTVVSCVKDLAMDVERAGLGAPAITIIGEVVKLRGTIGWFENRPLFGKTVVVTRTREQASELSRRLGELGAAVIEAPTIEVAPPEDWSGVDAALSTVRGADWVVFTSANGVAKTRDRLAALGLDSRAFGGAKIAVVGKATGDAVRERLFLKVDVCPERGMAETLAEEFEKRGEVMGKRFVLLRADIARPVLRERLEKGGGVVTDVSVYETRRARRLPAGVLEMLEEGKIDWVTFTSGSTVRNFLEMLGDGGGGRLGKARVASIGPVTSLALRDLGVEGFVEARTFDVEGLVAAILEGTSKTI